jgi:RNA polymerase sigma factor (sigma-70 family)
MSTETLAATFLLKGPYLRARLSPALSEAASEVRGRALLEAHLDLIQRQLHQLTRRSGLPNLEVEEFHSWVLLKLVEDNYRILGSWKGRSSFPTFVTVVLVNLLRDYRTHLWGRWRPSAACRRKGRATMLLEQLLVRDGLSKDEALERLRTQHGFSLAPDEVERLVTALPRRQKWRRASEEELLQIPIDGRVEVRIEEEESACIADRLRDLLVPLLQSLPAEDRLLLRLSFFAGLSMAAIAPLLGRPQRELYMARTRCLKKIRRSLIEAGLVPDRVGELIGRFQGNLGLEMQLRAQEA